MRLICALLALLLAAPVSFAQTEAPTALVADEVTYLPKEDKLVAEGNVTVLYDGQRIETDRVIFDNKTGDLEVQGPIRVRLPDGSDVIADNANLSNELEAGLIYGARLLLADNFQFAAAEVRRIDERYTTLYRAVGSSCQVCADQPIPLWLIRAERVVRDAEELQVHFQNATFEVFGVTVAYLPYFRMADPALDRATGFLNPEFLQSGIYGEGLKLPYYIVLSGSQDLTITPFLISNGASIAEFEYRQRFRSGRFNLIGSIAANDGDGSILERGHVFAEGTFSIGSGYQLNFDLKRTFDKSYLGTFGYSSADRLTSSTAITRQSETDYVAVTAIGFQSLRQDEPDASLPYVVPEVSWKHVEDGVLGGRMSADLDAVALVRRDGRDVAETGLRLGWETDVTLGPGILGKAFGAIDGRLYAIRDDDARHASAVTPAFGIDMRWPLARYDESATHVFEPVAQLVWSERYGDTDDIPNEDSAAMEFDAANLFALNRYPGNDRAENGMRLNVGANFTRIDSDGWQVGATIGQVIRTESTSGFPDNTGLNGVSSNIVAAANLSLPPIFSLSSQTLFDRSLSFSRNDIAAELKLGDLSLGGSYIYLLEDPSALSFETRNELRLETDYKIDDNWDIDLSWQRNLAEDRNVRATMGLRFGNECITTRISASRRFTSSATLPSTTEYGLTLELAGLGGKAGERAQRCVSF